MSILTPIHVAIVHGIISEVADQLNEFWTCPCGTKTTVLDERCSGCGIENVDMVVNAEDES